MSKRKTSEPSAREKLAAKLAEALQADFEQHGVSTIERLREKYPERYVDAVTKLTVPTEPAPAPDDFRNC